MREMKIWGGEPLMGKIRVSGAKNGALPLLFASMIAGDICTFHNLPDIGDVRLAVALLSGMGAEVRWLDRGILRIDPRGIERMGVDVGITSRLRASSYLLGACLGRFGAAPPLITGGCDFGARPLDCHYDFFHAVGAEGTDALVAPSPLHGGIHTFPRVSVGATVNALLTAACIPEEVVLQGCATEGHVRDLARFLTLLGVEIAGIGTTTLRVRGTSCRGGGSYIVSPDEIEAGTYLLATAACGGEITLTDVNPVALASPLAVLAEMGCEITAYDTALRLRRTASLRPVHIETAPAPGFPTDLHPPLVAALLSAAGEGSVRECVWQDRFRYTRELARMGAHLITEGDTVRVYPSRLGGADVTATDLRGGAALVLAALTARGRTTIAARELLDRGYEDLARKLRALGAAVL